MDFFSPTGQDPPVQDSPRVMPDLTTKEGTEIVIFNN